MLCRQTTWVFGNFPVAGGEVGANVSAFQGLVKMSAGLQAQLHLPDFPLDTRSPRLESLRRLWRKTSFKKTAWIKALQTTEFDSANTFV